MDYQLYYFIFKALQKVCRTPGPTAYLKLLHKVTIFEKVEKGEKSIGSLAASNLQPSNWRSNAYRSVPGSQDVFSWIYAFIGALKSDLLSQSTPCGTKWRRYHMDIARFIYYYTPIHSLLYTQYTLTSIASSDTSI